MVCPKCQTWMLCHPNPELNYKKWKRCPSCGYCQIIKSVTQENDSKNTSKTAIDSPQEKADNRE